MPGGASVPHFTFETKKVDFFDALKQLFIGYFTNTADFLSKANLSEAASTSLYVLFTLLTYFFCIHQFTSLSHQTPHST